MSSIELKSEMIESENDENILNNDKPAGYLELELNRLHELIELKNNENANLELKLAESETQANLRIDQLNHDFTLKLEQTLEKFQEGQQSSQNSLVMKYASTEKRCMGLTRNIEILQSKLTDSNQENQKYLKDSLKAKQDLENMTKKYNEKCVEVFLSRKECDQLRANLLINEAKHEIVDEKQHESLKKELNVLRSKLIDINEEVTALKDNLRCMDLERSRQNERLYEFEALNKKYLDQKKDQQEKLQLQDQVNFLKTELNSLQSEMTASQEKQNDLLSFTAKLTEKNTQLLTDLKILNEKLEELQKHCQLNSLMESNDLMLNELKIADKKLTTEINRNLHLEECLNAKNKELEELNVKMSDLKDEIVMVKKKNANIVKDLTKQLQQLNNKISSLSFNSLSSFEDKSEKIESSLISECRMSSSDCDELTPMANLNEVVCGSYNSEVYVTDVEKQKLIEKIVNLQNILAKKKEKIDFLEDHVNQLTFDLKRKTKIIQVYAINHSNEENENTKQQMSRKVSGFMSAFYFNNTNEANLANEVISKLQSLLEDTLIKNITLKENLETLGKEIKRLSH